MIDNFEVKNNSKAKRIIFNLILGIVFIATFAVLSYLAFKYARGEYNENFISLYIFSCIFFLIGILGILFQNFIFNIIYKIGYKTLSNSPEYADALVSPPRAFKTFQVVMLILNIISAIILIALILICVFK